MNSRGLAEQWVVYGIFLLASLLVITGSVTTLFAKVDDKQSIMQCRASVLLRKDMNAISERLSPILCETRFQTVPQKVDAEEEQVKREIAGSIKDCWFQFGNGVVPEIFKDWVDIDFRNDCFVCSVINIDDVPGARGGFTGRDFKQYLSQTTVTRKSYDAEEGLRDVDLYTYTEYVQGSGGPGKIVVRDGLVFRPEASSYYVAYVSPEFLFKNDLWKFAVTSLSEDKNTVSYILVEESDKVPDICQIEEDIAG